MAIQCNATISSLIKLNGSLSPVIQLKGDVKDTPDVISATMSASIQENPIYNGPYDVIPDARYDRTLETKDKLLTENINVSKVPFHETHNDYGTTVYIAMEV